jgi:hypothetical protein
MYTYYCVKCDRPSNKPAPLCCHCQGSMAERDAHLRYLRRFRPLKYAKLAVSQKEEA